MKAWKWARNLHGVQKCAKKQALNKTVGSVWEGGKEGLIHRVVGEVFFVKKSVACCKKAAILNGVMNNLMTLLPSNGTTANTYAIVGETEKALQLKLEGANLFPVWVPKKAIVEEIVDFSKFSQELGICKIQKFANWFLPAKAWQRVALGFSCY